MVKSLWLNSLKIDDFLPCLRSRICLILSWYMLLEFLEIIGFMIWMISWSSYLFSYGHTWTPRFYFVHIHGWNVEQLKSLIMVGWNHDPYDLWLEYNTLSDEIWSKLKISSWSYFHQDLSKTVVELGQEDWTWHKNWICEPKLPRL